MAPAAEIGTEVFITTYRTEGGHFFVNDRGVIGVYGNIDTAKKAGIDFVKEYCEEELTSWYPPTTTKEDRSEADKGWKGREWSDEEGWHFEYAITERGFEAKVKKYLVQ